MPGVALRNAIHKPVPSGFMVSSVTSVMSMTDLRKCLMVWVCVSKTEMPPLF
jgi:hypothetical protein